MSSTSGLRSIMRLSLRSCTTETRRTRRRRENEWYSLSSGFLRVLRASVVNPPAMASFAPKAGRSATARLPQGDRPRDPQCKPEGEPRPDLQRPGPQLAVDVQARLHQGQPDLLAHEPPGVDQAGRQDPDRRGLPRTQPVF